MALKGLSNWLWKNFMVQKFVLVIKKLCKNSLYYYYKSLFLQKNNLK